MTIESQLQSTNNNSDEISLKDLILKIRKWWRFILSKWLIVLGFGLLGGFLGFCYAYIKKPIYTATTTFVLEDGGSNTGAVLGNLGGLASMAGIDIGSGGGIFQGDNILELYKSRAMIEKTLLTSVVSNGKPELLVDIYINFNKLRDQWEKNKELKNIQFHQKLNTDGRILDFTRLQDSVMSEIVNDINKNYLSVAKPDKKLSIIYAQVKAPDEFFAKAFNEQIVKNVNDFYVQTKIKKAMDNVTILQQKTDSVRAVMNNAIYNAALVADATPNLNPTKQVQRIAPVQRSQFSAETNKAILGSLVQNLEMSKIALRKETPLIQVIDTPVYPLLKAKLGIIKGTVVGGIIFGFFAVLFLFGGFVFKQLLNESN